MKKAILYGRVSTDEQAENGHSLHYQKTKLKEYCKNNKIKKFEYYEDDGYSAKNLKRPMMCKIMNEIVSGEVSEIVVVAFDRLTRSGEDYYKLESLTKTFNVKITSLTQTFGDGSLGKYIKAIVVATSEFEREQIRERTIRGIEGGLEKGKYSFWGNLPLGIKRTKDNTLEYDDKIEIVKYMFKLHKKEYSFRKIRDKVNVKYELDKDVSYYERLIKNPLYRGYRKYNGKKYYFLKPIIKEKSKEKLNNRSLVKIRRRNITNHTYLFQKHLGDNFYVTTAKKYVKSIGEYREYKYYISKSNSKIRIREQDIVKAIETKVKSNEKEIAKAKRESLLKCKRMYLTNELTKEEYVFLKSKIEKRFESQIDVEELKIIHINEEKQLKIVLKEDNRVIRTSI